MGIPPRSGVETGNSTRGFKPGALGGSKGTFGYLNRLCWQSRSVAELKFSIVL